MAYENEQLDFEYTHFIDLSPDELSALGNLATGYNYIDDLTGGDQLPFTD